ncbi:hypothetical protein ACHHYP_05488 [Achlya hypogyna]|uniref:Uncharacterized protein n=1 Tax=Achlya hypogyna TaxID=1202772 RepID=A0A1V9YXI8_ACHHY|nr:hypothetical protein ACHHYP_05488 [Achlya hypogyna]
MAPTHKSKTGRPAHAVWAHYIRGEKRNGFHHHVYCRYCSDAQAQALAAPSNPAAGPLSIEAIRGVPKNMLRHLSLCMYCPAPIRAEIRSMADEHAASSSRKRRREPEMPPQPLLDLLLSDGPERPSPPLPTPSEKETATSLSPDDTLVQIALGGFVPWGWAWHPEVARLLAPTVDVPTPNVLYERCLAHKAPTEPTLPFATLSVASWTSVCAHEFTVACTLVHATHRRTLTIAGIEPTLDACVALLSSVLPRCPPLVAVVVDSALLLRAAEASLPGVTPLVCARSLLRFLSAATFARDDRDQHPVANATWYAYAGAVRADMAWAALHAAYGSLDATGFAARDALALFAGLSQAPHPLLLTVTNAIDGRLFVLAYVLHTATQLHWLRLGASVRHFSLLWQLDADLVVAQVIELRKGQFPFDDATKALYAHDVVSFYAFLSESHPPLHAFCSRLFSIVPVCASFEQYLPGLAEVALCPHLARIDVPVPAQSAIVQHCEATSPNRTLATPPSTATSDDWASLTADVAAFVATEAAAWGSHPKSANAIDWRGFAFPD